MSIGIVIAALSLGGGEVGARAFLLVLMVPGAAFATRCLVRAPKGSVSIEPEGVRIVGLVRTRLVPLAEAKMFRPQFSQTPMVRLTRVEGRVYPLWVTQRGIAGRATKRNRERLTQLSDELNGALAGAKGVPVERVTTA
jgi:hypothetical protein